MFPETKQGAAYFQMSINRAFLSDESQITREIVASMANHSPLHNFHRSPCLYPHPCADAAQRVHMHALTRDHVFDANFAERKAVNRGQPLRREHVAFGCDLPRSIRRFIAMPAIFIVFFLEFHHLRTFRVRSSIFTILINFVGFRWLQGIRLSRTDVIFYGVSNLKEIRARLFLSIKKDLIRCVFG